MAKAGGCRESVHIIRPLTIKPYFYCCCCCCCFCNDHRIFPPSRSLQCSRVSISQTLQTMQFEQPIISISRYGSLISNRAKCDRADRMPRRFFFGAYERDNQSSYTAEDEFKLIAVNLNGIIYNVDNISTVMLTVLLMLSFDRAILLY